MMTTPYAALISDPNLFRGSDNDVQSRNRRLLYIAVFWGGTFAGAVMVMRSTMAVATFAVLMCKVAVMVYVSVVSAGDVPVSTA